MRTKAFLYSVNKCLWFYKITVAMTILMAIGCAATQDTSKQMPPQAEKTSPRTVGINNALGDLREAAPEKKSNTLGVGGLYEKNDPRHPSVRDGARVRPGKVVIQGPIKREDVQRTVKRHMNQIKYCYAKEVAKDKDIQGEVVALWTIAATGLVEHIKIERSTIKNSAVEKCIVKVLARTSYNKPEGNEVGTVTYPFNFYFVANPSNPKSE